MQLSEFLAAYPPDAELEVAAWRSDGETHVRCVLHTSPWWVDAAQRLDADGTLTIECGGVVDAEVRVGWRHSDVQDLEVLDDHPLLWSHGAASIYGNAPLPDPGRFFMELADLVEQTGAARGVTLLLGTTAQAWRQRVTGHAPYLLLTAQTTLVEACLPLLDEQQADYSVLRAPGRSTPRPLRLVVIGASWIICQDAMVEVDPPPV